MDTNAELLAKLDSAFKAITEVSTLGRSVLVPQKFAQFVREAQHATVVLPEARFIEMTSHTAEIDRIGFVGQILDTGDDEAGDHRDLAENEFVEPQTSTNELIARELIAIASLRDKALRRNIERGGFEDTLIDLFAEAAGRDLEMYALLGDKTGTPFTGSRYTRVVSKTDGWVRRAAQKLYGRGGAGADFDPTAAFDATSPAINEFPLNMFQAQLESLPKQFLGNVSEWRYWVPWDVFDAYRTSLINRGTQLGDRAITENLLPPFKGIPVLYTPLLERAPAVNLADPAIVERDRIEGRISLLGHPDNMAWGVFHEVTVEPEREAKKRRTDYTLVVEPDADYEDENAAVAAFLDKSSPAGS